MGNPGNPDYLNDLKNTFNNFSEAKLLSAARELHNVLLEDFPKIFEALHFDELFVCVVPRAKSENAYHENQKLFRAVVQKVVRKFSGFVDGTSCLSRHTNTKTTHLRSEIPGYINDGSEPYRGITQATCDISNHVKDKNVLLIDDIYTPNVNIDEDAIQALLQAGASTVTFYSVGRVGRY